MTRPTTPLHLAVEKHDIDAIIALADIETVAAQGQYDETPLHLAAFTGDLDACKALVEAGADPKVIDVLGRTPLHLAAREKHVMVCQFLVERGANPDVKDSEGYTARDFAVSDGDPTTLSPSADTRAEEAAVKAAYVADLRAKVDAGVNSVFFKPGIAGKLGEIALGEPAAAPIA